ncbi:MAG: creatininase family protein [Pseudomonadota bacterium]
MQLALSTWIDIESYLEHSKGIIVPIGSMEQHGPTGLIGTDSICPETIAKRVGDEKGVLIGPTFNVGCAQHHLGFPGSMTLRPSTMIAAMCDWTRSLARHGFEKIYWLNGHGGNIATINAAFVEYYAQRSLDTVPAKQPTMTMKLKNWWDFKTVLDMAKTMHPEGEGMHATASEVAVTYAAYPEQVRDLVLEPKIAPTGSFTDAYDYRKKFPDGRIGSDPTQATIANGHRLIETTAECVASDFEVFVSK